MAETLHHGGCHCGAVRYHVDVDLTKPAIACNCEMVAVNVRWLDDVELATIATQQFDGRSL